MGRIKQLDSLRAIAVIMVIIHHSPVGMNNAFLDAFPMGANMFMVLSGYLITAILLHEKEKALLLGTGHFAVYRNFIAKRALRIFPLYFFVVLLLVLIQGRTNPYLYLSLASFTSNFYQYYKQEWNEYAHTWSLSVQEHFYLLWPMVVLLTPRRWMLPVILFFIGFGIFSQRVLFSHEFGNILTPSCFDALGAGALLAWMMRSEKVDFTKAYRWLSAAALICFSVFLYCYLSNIRMPLPFRTLYAVMIMWLIATIVHGGERTLLNRFFLLNNPVLPFLGTISFGLYLLHPIVPDFTYSLLRWVNKVLPAGWAAYRETIVLFENSVLLVLVSWLSYRLIKMPFLKLKKHFQTRRLVPATLELAAVLAAHPAAYSEPV